MKAQGPSFVIVSGARNAGKTSYLDFLATRARQRNLKVGGFLSRGEWEDGVKSRYWLEDLQTGGRRLLAWPFQSDAKNRTGRYAFSPDAFAWAHVRIRQSLHADLILLDEIGPLEMSGQGFAPILDFLKDNYQGILILTVRPSLRRAFLDKIPA